MKLTFFGGARTVTGANYLLETGEKKILIDCGMFEGFRFAEERNYNDFPYRAKDIDAVIVTHAHIDHTGRIPKLVKDGFRGKIFSTRPTGDLARIMLEDSIDIISDEARRDKHVPLFVAEDVEKAIKLFSEVDYGEEIKLSPSLTFIFKDAGHILGSAFIELVAKGTRITFSGDLGNSPTPLLRDRELPGPADYVLVESTYGDRIHEDRSTRKDILEDVIEETIGNGGVLMIPAFALERTQELLFELNELVENHRVPKVPIFIDSPLAIKATEIYKKYPEYYNKEAAYLIDSGDKLFQFPRLTFTSTVEESKAINDVPAPKVIIAGSGMSMGGRILHHEKRYLPDSKSTLLLMGYQAPGTIGRRILKGEKEVFIHGETVSVNARVCAIGGYSAHADQEALISWIRAIAPAPKKVFAVQGEDVTALALVQKLRDHYGIYASAPMVGDSVSL